MLTAFAVEDPSFSLTIDHRHIVRVRVHGGLSPAIMARFWPAFAPAIATVSGVGVGAGMAIHYAPDDRLAIVVDSTPLKAQIRQQYALKHREAFLSRDAALAWLENN